MDEILITIVGTFTTIMVSLISLAYWLGKKFAQIDGRFAQIDARFAQIDERFESLEKRISGAIKDLEGKIGDTAESLEGRISDVAKSLEGRISDVAKSLEGRINGIARATKSQLEFFAEFLGFRKILEQRDVVFVKSELSRLLMAQAKAINPLTKEETRRLKELIEKDKLTLQEADELREIARKLVDEYGHEISETWKLLIYASIMRGIALSEQK